MNFIFTRYLVLLLFYSWPNIAMEISGDEHFRLFNEALTKVESTTKKDKNKRNNSIVALTNLLQAAQKRNSQAINYIFFNDKKIAKLLGIIAIGAKHSVDITPCLAKLVNERNSFAAVFVIQTHEKIPPDEKASLGDLILHDNNPIFLYNQLRNFENLHRITEAFKIADALISEQFIPAIRWKAAKLFTDNTPDSLAESVKLRRQLINDHDDLEEMHNLAAFFKMNPKFQNYPDEYKDLFEKAIEKGSILSMSVYAVELADGNNFLEADRLFQQAQKLNELHGNEEYQKCIEINMGTVRNMKLGRGLGINLPYRWRLRPLGDEKERRIVDGKLKLENEYTVFLEKLKNFHLNANFEIGEEIDEEIEEKASTKIAYKTLKKKSCRKKRHARQNKIIDRRDEKISSVKEVSIVSDFLADQNDKILAPASIIPLNEISQIEDVADDANVFLPEVTNSDEDRDAKLVDPAEVDDFSAPRYHYNKDEQREKCPHKNSDGEFNKFAIIAEKLKRVQSLLDDLLQNKPISNKGILTILNRLGVNKPENTCGSHNKVAVSLIASGKPSKTTMIRSHKRSDPNTNAKALKKIFNEYGIHSVSQLWQ